VSQLQQDHFLGQQLVGLPPSAALYPDLVASPTPTTHPPGPQPNRPNLQSFILWLFHFSIIKPIVDKMEGEHEQLAEVLINGLPFKTTFPPPTRMSPAQSGT
jgi:hypothetical protein